MLSLLSRCANSAFAPRLIYTALRIHAGLEIPVTQKSAIPAIPGRDFVYNLMNVRYIMWVDRGALGHLIFYVLFFHDLYTILNMFSTYSKRTPSILKKCSPEPPVVFRSKTKLFRTLHPDLWIITMVIVVFLFHNIRKACMCPICPIWFAATTVIT